jgi:2,3-bisphosphoglycerate-independent phosphoglycerate mutase
MYEKPKKPGAPLKAKTSHTLNKVPFIVYNADVTLKQDDDLGLSNIASTVCEVLGVEPNEHWRPSIIEEVK